MTAVAPITATARAQAVDVATYNTAVATNGVMFGFNAQRTFFNSYERFISPANVSKLVQDWTVNPSNDFLSSPAVANGVVYVGSTNHKFYAFKAKSGAILWTANAGDRAAISPAVANGVVYVSTFNGKIYAFHLPGVSLY